MKNYITEFFELYDKVDQSTIVDFGKNSEEFYELIKYIDTLSHEDRILIRKELAEKKRDAPRNLYFDYKLQVWIE